MNSVSFIESAACTTRHSSALSSASRHSTLLSHTAPVRSAVLLIVDTRLLLFHDVHSGHFTLCSSSSRWLDINRSFSRLRSEPSTNSCTQNFSRLHHHRRVFLSCTSAGSPEFFLRLQPVPEDLIGQFSHHPCPVLRSLMFQKLRAQICKSYTLSHQVAIPPAPSPRRESSIPREQAYTLPFHPQSRWLHALLPDAPRNS